jgi:hypothetical protein
MMTGKGPPSKGKKRSALSTMPSFIGISMSQWMRMPSCSVVKPIIDLGGQVPPHPGPLPKGRGSSRPLRQRPFSPAISACGYGNSKRQSRQGEIAGEGPDEGVLVTHQPDLITPTAIRGTDCSADKLDARTSYGSRVSGFGRHVPIYAVCPRYQSPISLAVMTVTSGLART